jgi:two-component system, NtrC family, response regulator AtoC
MILEDSSYITPPSLPMSISHQAALSAATPPRPRPRLTFPPAIPDAGLSLEDNERRLLVQALEKTGGNQTQAARLLRITRDTLRYKMKKFDIR